MGTDNELIPGTADDAQRRNRRNMLISQGGKTGDWGPMMADMDQRIELLEKKADLQDDTNKKGKIF